MYPNGELCISILKTNDPTGYIDTSEMWSPVLSIEKVLISVINVLCGNILNKIKIIKNLILEVQLILKQLYINNIYYKCKFRNYLINVKRNICKKQEV